MVRDLFQLSDRRALIKHTLHSVGRRGDSDGRQPRSRLIYHSRDMCMYQLPAIRTKHACTARTVAKITRSRIRPTSPKTTVSPKPPNETTQSRQ